MEERGVQVVAPNAIGQYLDYPAITPEILARSSKRNGRWWWTWVGIRRELALWVSSAAPSAMRPSKVTPTPCTLSSTLTAVPRYTGGVG